MGWALPVAIVGGIFLIREVKGSGAAIEDTARRLAAEAAAESKAALDKLLADAAASGAAAGQAYYGAQDAASRQAALEALIADTERLTALQRERGELRLGGGGYGTVMGSLGGFTGDWENVTAGTGDRCSVRRPTISSSNTLNFFTGAYCRSARAQGLIN